MKQVRTCIAVAFKWSGVEVPAESSNISFSNTLKVLPWPFYVHVCVLSYTCKHFYKLYMINQWFSHFAAANPVVAPYINCHH